MLLFLWRTGQSRRLFFQSLPMWLYCPQTAKALGLAVSSNCWNYIIPCWDMRWLLVHGKHVDEEALFQGLLGSFRAVRLPLLYDLLGVVTSASWWLSYGVGVAQLFQINGWPALWKNSDSGVQGMTWCLCYLISLNSSVFSGALQLLCRVEDQSKLEWWRPVSTAAVSMDLCTPCTCVGRAV